MIETLLKDNISLYYVIMFLVLIFSLTLNLTKELRSKQTKIAKYYIILAIILFAIIILNRTIAEVLVNTKKVPGEDLYNLCVVIMNIFGFLLQLLGEVYNIITLVIIGIGLLIKFTLRFSDNDESLDNEKANKISEVKSKPNVNTNNSNLQNNGAIWLCNFILSLVCLAVIGICLENSFSFEEGATIIGFIIGCGVLFNKLLKNSNNYKEVMKNNNSQIINNSRKNNVAKNKKENFLIRKFYNKNKSLNETGIVVAKVTQVIAYTLVLVYLLVPIFWYFDMEIVGSPITILFMMITFFEIYFALTGVKIEDKSEAIKAKEQREQDLNSLKSRLKKVLKFSEIEFLEESERMVESKNTFDEQETALICEVPNFEEFKDINMKVMNSSFFENKKVLVIVSSMKNANKYHSKLTTFNSEYDGKIALKLLTEQDKLFDSLADIYISTLENCFGNIKLLNQIDTIIIEDFDVIMQKKLELLRAFGSIVKMGNPNIKYVILTYMIQGIEATIKNLLLVNNITWHSTKNKQQAKKILLNIWDKNEEEITSAILGKVNKNIGTLIPLSLLSLKSEADRILIISADEPLDFQLNELNAVKGLHDKNFVNSEIEMLNNNAEIKDREKYFEYRDRNWIIINDKSNLYEKIYKLSLVNGIENEINIVSEQYLLRDYMINMYFQNRTRLKSFLPYVPFEVDNSKVILYNLLLQLTNFGVRENVISRVLNENGIKTILGKGNNIRLISDKLNYYIRLEFGIDIDIYSYITIQNVENKYVFDTTKKYFIEEEKIYLLDESVLTLFPDEIFKRVSFAKAGFKLDVEKEYAYNFYQKYLPGQKHCLNGHVYEIKSIVESEDEINAIVEASTNYDNNTYRQKRKINLLSGMSVLKTKAHKYNNILSKYTVGKMDFEVETEGYFEFKNGIKLLDGEYRYISLDNNTVEKIRRKHVGADVLKIEFSNIISEVIEKVPTKKRKAKVVDSEQVEEQELLNDEVPVIEESIQVEPKIHKLFTEKMRDQIANDLAFLLSETLITMLGENSNYVQVKSSVKSSKNIAENTWVSPIIKEDSTNENIEIFIFEDTKIERGLIDVIYKNLDNIFSIIYDYLDWVFKDNLEYSKVGALSPTVPTNMDKLRSIKLEFLRGIQGIGNSSKGIDFYESYQHVKELLRETLMK